MNDVEIIADLFIYLMAVNDNYKDLHCVKHAVKRLRDAEKNGATMNGLAATYCYPEHTNYQKFGDLEGLE